MGFYSNKENLEGDRVYLAQCRATKLVKIGKSQDPERRVLELSTGSPGGVDLIDSFAGSFREEKKLHEQWAAYRRHGEWFELVGSRVLLTRGFDHAYCLVQSFDLKNKGRAILKRERDGVTIDAAFHELKGPAEFKDHDEAANKEIDNNLTFTDFCNEETTVGRILCCPGCGNGYLHHDTVVVYERFTEDGPGRIVAVTHEKGEKVVVLDKEAVASELMGRRNGFRVLFSCENCPRRSVLSLMQHKGNTYVEWEDSPDDGPAPEHCL